MAKAPVNNPTCVPSPKHPNRVVFIHGTSDNSTRWQKAANALSMQGFCTWAFNYGKPNKTSMLEPVDGADVANVEVGAACKLPIAPAHAAMPQNNPTIGLILWGLTRKAGDHTPTTEHCSSPARGSASTSAAGS